MWEMEEGKLFFMQIFNGKGKFVKRKRKDLRKRANILGSGWKDFFFVLPSLCGVSVFVFLPFVDVVRRSFTNLTGSRFTGFLNYREVWENRAFRLAMGNTLKFLGACVPLLLGASLLLACLVYSGCVKWYQNVCLLPMAVPAASLVFVWKMVFARYGVLNSAFSLSIDWLNSSSAFWVLSATFLWKNMGYYVVLWMTGLSGIPKSLYEAASLDGAGALAKFRYVTLPGLRPMADAVCILAVTGVFKSYRESYLLAGEYPDKSIYMVQHMFHNWFRDMSMEKMSAAAVAVTCMFAVLVYPFRKRGGGNLGTFHP